MFNITDKAKDKIQEILGQQNSKYIRLYLQGMG
jgi:hypothetical protein